MEKSRFFISSLGVAQHIAENTRVFGFALDRDRAACAETAAKATKPASVGMISRILASIVGGTTRQTGREFIDKS
jgi:hypothetical protein